MASEPSWLTDDTRALLGAIVALDDVDEASLFLRDLCTLNEIRDMSQRWAVVRLLDAGPALRRDLADDRCKHGHDHPDRVMAPPRRGRLPSDARPARRIRRSRDRVLPDRRPSDERPSPAGRPEQGPPRRADARPPPRRRARLRGARSQPRRPGPEPRPRHPLRPDQRRDRVRRRWRRRPRRDRGRPAGRDRIRPAPVRELGYGRCRLAAAVPSDSPITAVEGLDGVRVATAHPNTTRRFFAERRIRST